MSASMAIPIDDLPTPALLLDRAVLERNCAAMAARASNLGVRLRPHLKTAKSAAVAGIATKGQFGGITVSTVAEAAYFAAHGFLDITYAVGIAPGKIAALDAVQSRTGALITLICDTPEAARAAAAAAAMASASFAVMIEIDTGGGRGGVAPDDPELLSIAAVLRDAPCFELTGVLTHAGQSYHAHGAAEIRAIAETERSGVVRAAARLRAAGHSCPCVSVGSTPTMVHAAHLDGVTEMRPGVYTFFDLDQAAIGACIEADIAVTVVATVIGHNRRSNRVLIDAGALALSKDLSAAEFRDDVGYGTVQPLGAPGLQGLRVAEVHQEHGLVAGLDGDQSWDAMPIGAKVRVLPNHACMTVAPFDVYHVVEPDGVVERWQKATGW